MFIENATPHSFRSASTTEEFNMNLDILDILKKAMQSKAILKNFSDIVKRMEKLSGYLPSMKRILISS